MSKTLAGAKMSSLKDKILTPKVEEKPKKVKKVPVKKSKKNV